jgi:hypothetical protein
MIHSKASEARKNPPYAATATGGIFFVRDFIMTQQRKFVRPPVQSTEAVTTRTTQNHLHSACSPGQEAVRAVRARVDQGWIER